jgi:RNA polymerase sigma factor (sigma-70 family)
MDPSIDMDSVDLLGRVRAGDEAAWAELTGQYTGMLWGLARGMRLSEQDAADAVQTTWLRLVERVDTIRHPDRVGGWLATTMRRECLAAIARREHDAPADGWDDLPVPGDPLVDGLIRDERDVALWRALRALRPRCQALLRVLMASPAPSHADAALALDMPVASVGPTRRRCLAALRQLMRLDPDPA